MKKIILKLSLAFALIIKFAFIIAAPLNWQTVAPGIRYAELTVTASIFTGKIHAFEIDLQKNQLRFAFAKQLNLPTASIEQFVTANKALLGINGGFFTNAADLLGLRLQDGLILNPLKSISWWGVFYISNNQPHIVAGKNFSYNKSITFAIQSGPRLIINSQIVDLKPSIDERSAIGITKTGKVILVATDNAPITTEQLAELMLASPAQGGLGCTDALNLDGGSSTQMYAQLNNFRLDDPSYKPVADAIIVIPKVNQK